MVERAKVERLLFSAVDAVNDLLPVDEQIPKDLGATLFTRDGGIDSISLVHLVSEFEALLEESIAPGVVLADERAMSRSASPFRTLGTLLDYALEQLERLPQPTSSSP